MTPTDMNQLKAEASKALHSALVELDEAVTGEVKRKVAAYVEALESEIERLRKQNEAMRSEIETLIAIACEFIAPNEDNNPECSCCGMQLTSYHVGHRGDCLANAILRDAAKSLQPDASARYLSPEDVKPLVEALTRINEISVIHHEWGEAIIWAGDALDYAKSLGL